MRAAPINDKLQRFTVQDGGFSSACWVWGGAVDHGGYGRFTHTEPGQARRTLSAHRESYKAYKGHIPEGFEVDHLCRNTRCINPDHLEAVTGKENNRRVVQHQHVPASHCRNGHEFTPENAVFDRAGYRKCRACIVARPKRCRSTEVRRSRPNLTPSEMDEIARLRLSDPQSHSLARLATRFRVSNATIVRATRIARKECGQ